MNAKMMFWSSLSGTVLITLCCFTPILVITLSALGLGALVGYLDYLLLPALGVFLIIAFLSYRRYQRS